MANEIRSSSTQSATEERSCKRLRSTPSPAQSTDSSNPIFGANHTRLFLGASTASSEWRIEDFAVTRRQADGTCLDGPKFGPREPWQIFCHPDGRCFNQPQGGSPGVFLRYLGSHERVPAYATIEKLVNGKFCVPENNARDAPFVVLFGRNEIEEWGVCKDFGLFDESFAQDLQDGALVLRARVTWIEPRTDSMLPREVVTVRWNAAPAFAQAEGSLQADLGVLWSKRRQGNTEAVTSCDGGAGAVVPADLVLICEGQRFDVDRAVIAARSSFFGAMLTDAFREVSQKEVEIPDLSAQALLAVLRFIYSDEGPEMHSKDEAMELLIAASKLGVPGLQGFCGDYLRDTELTVATSVELLRLADSHGATSLRNEALAVLAANFDSVKTTPEWESLLVDGMNPKLIQDAMQAVRDAAITAGRASIKL